jgi:hypothetical protein
MGLIAVVLAMSLVSSVRCSPDWSSAFSAVSDGVSAQVFPGAVAVILDLSAPASQQQPGVRAWSWNNTQYVGQAPKLHSIDEGYFGDVVSVDVAFNVVGGSNVDGRRLLFVCHCCMLTFLVCLATFLSDDSRRPMNLWVDR